MLMASGCPATSNSELVHMRAASMPTGLARFAQRVATSPRPCACVTRTLQSAAVLASSGFHSEPVFAILQMFAKFCQILPNFAKFCQILTKITFLRRKLPFLTRTRFGCGLGCGLLGPSLDHPLECAKKPVAAGPARTPLSHKPMTLAFAIFAPSAPSASSAMRSACSTLSTASSSAQAVVSGNPPLWTWPDRS